jgi:hypothetical protein
VSPRPNGEHQQVQIFDREDRERLVRIEMHIETMAPIIKQNDERLLSLEKTRNLQRGGGMLLGFLGGVWGAVRWIIPDGT